MQVYGFGKSEELIGDLRQKYNNYKPVIATKVAPLPWRFAEGNVRNALKVSLLQSVHLLQAGSTLNLDCTASFP